MSSSCSVLKDQDDAYLFSCRLNGLSDEVTVDQLYSLLSPVSSSIVIRILPTHFPLPLIPIPTCAPEPHSQNAFLLNPHHSYIRSAEILLRTEDEVDRLIKMDSKLRGYAIMLQVPLHYLQRSSPFPTSQQTLRASEHPQLLDSQRTQVISPRSSPQGASARLKGGSLWDGKEGMFGASEIGGCGLGSLEYSSRSSIQTGDGIWLENGERCDSENGNRFSEDEVYLDGKEYDNIGRRSVRLDVTSRLTVPKSLINDPPFYPLRTSPWSSSRSSVLDHPVSSLRSTASWTPVSEGRGGSMMFSPGPNERLTIQGPRNLYVLNLPLATTQMEFDDMFAHYGKVEHACLLSMLDPQGRRRGFVLMSTHEEAMTALNSAHGQSFRGYRLDISWSQVQKSNVDEIQRGRMTNRQRFLPPPIAPTIADYRLPFSFSHARPHTGVQERSPYGEAMRPWDEMSVGGSSEGDRPKRILGRVVVMVDLDPAHFDDIVTLIHEASAFGEVSYACYMSQPSHSNLFPSETRSSTRSGMVRYFTTACADSAVNFMAKPEFCAKKLNIRYAEWSDLDKITSVDRKEMMYMDEEGTGLQRHGLWDHMMHNRGFPTTVFNHHMRSDSNRVESFPPPLIFSPTDTDFNSNPSPISPLLRYSVKTPPPAIGKAYYQDMIWKTQGSSFGAVGSGEGSIHEIPTKIWTVGNQKLCSNHRGPAAVWWNGAIQLDVQTSGFGDGLENRGRI